MNAVCVCSDVLLILVTVFLIGDASWPNHKDNYTD